MSKYRLFATLLFLIVGLLCAGGCRLTESRVVPSPLSYSEQAQAILRIVPQGTMRDEAIPALERAGIQGNFGINQSVYYCDLWNREDGQRWHLNVALLFDSTGHLYNTRPAKASIEIDSTDAGNPPIAENTRSGSSNNSQEAVQGATFDSTPEQIGSKGSPRNGRRSPFADSEELR